jgi:hypothetical protein
MGIVEREHEPHRYDSWAITRDDFAQLIEACADVLTAGDEERTCRVTVPGYERPFTGAAEFLENISEAQWRDLPRVLATVSAGAAPNVLSADVYVWAEYEHVELRVAGRTRRDRNSVEPELKELVGRHVPGAPTQRSVAILVTGMTSVPVMALAVLVGAVAVLLGLDAFWFFPGGLVVVAAAAFTVMSVFEQAKKLRPMVELLPDDGKSRWMRFRAAATNRGAVVGGGVTTLAALVGAIAAVVAAVR